MPGFVGAPDCGLGGEVAPKCAARSCVRCPFRQSKSALAAMVDCMARNEAVTVADRGVFQPIWTERIGGEWRRNAERLLQIPPETLAEQWIALN